MVLDWLFHDALTVAILLALLVVYYVMRVVALLLSHRAAEVRLRECLARIYARARAGG